MDIEDESFDDEKKLWERWKDKGMFLRDLQLDEIIDQSPRHDLSIEKRGDKKMAKLEDYFSEDEIFELAKSLTDEQKQEVGEFFDDAENDENTERYVELLKKQLVKEAKFQDEEIHKLLISYLNKFPVNAESALKKLLSHVSNATYGYGLEKRDAFPSLNALPFFGAGSRDVKKKDSDTKDPEDLWPSLG